MSLTKFTENMSIISELPDAPTETAQELKAKFDEAGRKIKEYLNNTLTVETEHLVETEKTSLQTSIANTSTALNQRINETNTELNETNAKIDSLITNTSNYTKYDDGTLICYGKVEVTSSISDYYNTVYRTDSIPVNFSKSFVSEPHITISPVGHQTLGHMVISPSTTGFSTMLFKYKGANDTTCVFNYIAIGKWK